MIAIASHVLQDFIIYGTFMAMAALTMAVGYEIREIVRARRLLRRRLLLALGRLGVIIVVGLVAEAVGKSPEGIQPEVRSVAYAVALILITVGFAGALYFDPDE